MPHVGRYAPSPSGDLHVGNARTALLAWLWARSEGGGRFLLRIEDLDPDRSRPEIERRQIEDLAALGLDWDETPVRQSERGPLNERALEKLAAAGLVYPCFCSRADVRAATVAPHGPGGAAYPGTCRALDPAEVARRLAGSARASLRYRSADGSDDHVLRRSDGVVGYQLAVVVDDGEQGGDARAAWRGPRTLDAEADRAVALARALHTAALPPRAARRRAGWKAPRQARRGAFDTRDSRVRHDAQAAGRVARVERGRRADSGSRAGSRPRWGVRRACVAVRADVHRRQSMGVRHVTRLQSSAPVAEPSQVNMAYDYELLAIGCGPAGQRAAIQTAKLGHRVAVVERPNFVGGVCTNTGTLPSKTLRAAALDLTGLLQKDMYGDAYPVKNEITVEDPVLAHPARDRPRDRGDPRPAFAQPRRSPDPDRRGSSTSTRSTSAPRAAIAA